MSENTSNKEQASGKPVNINISFNISRKEVTQNINSLDHQKAFNLKNQNMDQSLPTNYKTKNHTARPLKTPQLAQTDRHVYSKNLQSMRGTEQLKRKKRRKRNSVDYTTNKTAEVPFYPLDMDRSLPTHKRGNTTTTIMKKNQSSTKCKKQPTKITNYIKQADPISIASIVNAGSKNDVKSIKLQKNLKNILNKLINNELSKRSLPLPSVPSKSKYYPSTALTARKIPTSARPSKKRSSKSQIMPKSKQSHSQSNIESCESSLQMFENTGILEKLGNFKSIQNSLLISETDNVEDMQNNGRQKNSDFKRIVIKTDQSIECIDEIQDWEKNFYKEEFFNDPKKKVYINRKTRYNQQEKDTSTNTLSLIETYVKLLNSHDQSIKLQDSLNRSIPHNVNQKVDIYEEENFNDYSVYKNKNDKIITPKGKKDRYQQLETDKIKNQQDFRKDKKKIEPQYFQIEQEEQTRVTFQKMQKKKQYASNKPTRREQPQEKSTRKQQQKYQQTRKQQPKYQQTRKQQPKYFQTRKQQSKSISTIKQQVLVSPLPVKTQNPINQKEQDNFRPFISSQMGRQSHLNEPSNSQQRARLNELKKHEIQKWGCLLEYIKSNMNSETSTQQVLQQVYDYLSKAKVDLIKEGQNLNGAQGQVKGELSSIREKQRLDEEFTNRLSSQQLSIHKTDLHQQQVNIPQSNPNTNKSSPSSIKSHSRLRSQQQQILDQQAKSFKQEYQSSSVEQQSLKFMNLSTIETALRNRFNHLSHKKEKDLEHYEELYEDSRVTQEEYEQHKTQIEITFKKETNEILMVKKNIWKGYNQAKGILDKSYITSRVQQHFGNQRGLNDIDSSDLKDRKMMKCLSQSYLTKKKIDYKKFIQQEEHKRQQQIEQHNLKTQKGHQKTQSKQQKQQGEQIYQQQQSYQGQDQSHQEQQDQQTEEYEEQENEEQYSGQHSDQYSDQQSISDSHIMPSEDQSNSRIKSSQLSDSINYDTKLQSIRQKLNQSPNHTVDQQFQKITQKINRLKEKHDEADAQDQRKQKSYEEELQQRQCRVINEVNEFTIEEHKYLPHGLRSPNLISASPDSSMHYEEIEKSLHTSSEGQYEHSEQDLGTDSGQDLKEYVEQQSKDSMGEIKHSSDEEEHEDYQSDEEYSEQEQQIIDQEFSGSTINTLTNTKHTPPLKSSLIQLQQQNLEQPTFKPKTIEKQSTNDLSSTSPQKPTLLQQQNQTGNTLTKKFKYLTEEDREDIFQFLFLDLCIELYQQPCKENRLMDSINRHVTKQHEMAKRKKGVKTNLNVVKDYLKRFCGYLLRTSKQVLDNMNVPMGPTAIEMLKYMHENDDFDEEPIDQNDGVVTLIVPVATFDTFERTLLPTLQFEKYYDNEEKEEERVNFLKNILHIHNKALFDGLNQFLDHQRPFGIWGKPFPWKKSSSFSRKFTEAENQQKLKKSAQKVVQACSYVCGLLVDKQQSLVGNTKISEGYIEQIREDRISRMLANEMIESQERWLFYDDEQTEVLVEASNFVYNNLLKELMQEFMSISNRQVQLVNV